MRQTNEQRAATERLRALAGGYRVKEDAEGWPIIPGRLNRIEWHCDGVNCHGCPMPGRPVLAVYTHRRRVHSRLLAIPAIQAHQRGNNELRAVLPPEALPQVAEAIHARRKRAPSPASLQNLAAGAASRFAPAS